MLKQVLEETLGRAMNQGNTCYKISTNDWIESKKLRRLRRKRRAGRTCLIWTVEGGWDGDKDCRMYCSARKHETYKASQKDGGFPWRIQARLHVPVCISSRVYSSVLPCSALFVFLFSCTTAWFISYESCLPSEQIKDLVIIFICQKRGNSLCWFEWECLP